MPVKVVKRGDAIEHLRSLYGRLGVGFAVVGVLDGNVPHEGSDLTVGELAAIHEFGAPAAGIPARSFLRLGMRRAHKPLMDLARAVFKGVANDKMTEAEALQKLSHLMLGHTLATFASRGPGWKPLAQSTIDKKGHADPLRDTDQLIDAIQAEAWVQK